jgi:hypothetical protein
MMRRPGQPRFPTAAAAARTHVRNDTRVLGLNVVEDAAKR